MHPAVGQILATVLATTDSPARSGGSLVTGSGTLAVALVGALSAVVVALVPELFKLLRPERGPAPPEVVTPQAVEALADTLRAEIQAAVGPIRADTSRSRSELRALRGALERRDEAMRGELEATRDALQRHEWGVHGLHGAVPPPDAGAPPVPGPRAAEPA